MSHFLYIYGSAAAITTYLVIEAPFDFRTETLENGQVKIRITRMYGCVLHSHLREERIRKYGTRDGWEPFGQW